jgi:hypothetical protein
VAVGKWDGTQYVLVDIHNARRAMPDGDAGACNVAGGDGAGYLSLHDYSSS